MPGVSLDLLPASRAPEALGSPDSACAESCLEGVIGDLLALEEAEDEEEQFCERKFELTLRCAVGEIHSDLQAFGKRVDARLEEAAAQVAPIAESLVRLQEENLRLRIQQERLVRQVEALCQVVGLPDPLPHVLPSKEYLTSVPCETETSLSDSQSSSGDVCMSASAPPGCTPRDTALDDSTSNIPDSPSSGFQDTPTNSNLDSLPSMPHGTILFPQDCVSSGAEPSPVPHPPTFATCRSLSAPSLMVNVYCNSEVLLSVIDSDNDLLVQMISLIP